MAAQRQTDAGVLVCFMVTSRLGGVGSRKQTNAPSVLKPTGKKHSMLDHSPPGKCLLSLLPSSCLDMCPG